MSIDPFEGAIRDEETAESQQETRYAGFWIRFVASAIDSVLALIVLLPILGLFSISDTKLSSSILESNSITTTLLESIFVSSGWSLVPNYFVPAIIILLFWIYRAATPGKIMLGLTIVSSNTLLPLSKGQSVARYLGYYVSCQFFGLGFIWAAFDSRKQGWHDKLAKTLVIYENKKGQQ
jgi:uncharacterized RDD family membrane protein YckC